MFKEDNKESTCFSLSNIFLKTNMNESEINNDKITKTKNKNNLFKKKILDISNEKNNINENHLTYLRRILMKNQIVYHYISHLQQMSQILKKKFFFFRLSEIVCKLL